MGKCQISKSREKPCPPSDAYATIKDSNNAKAHKTSLKSLKLLDRQKLVEVVQCAGPFNAQSQGDNLPLLSCFAGSGRPRGFLCRRRWEKRSHASCAFQPTLSSASSREALQLAQRFSRCVVGGARIRIECWTRLGRKNKKQRVRLEGLVITIVAWLMITYLSALGTGSWMVLPWKQKRRHLLAHLADEILRSHRRGKLSSRRHSDRVSR